MIPVETVPGIRAGGMKETSRGSEFKYDIFDTYLLQCTPSLHNNKKRKEMRHSIHSLSLEFLLLF
jgi:hypothetical protein